MTAPDAVVASDLAEHRFVHRSLVAGQRNPFRCTCDKWAAVIVADGRDGDGVSMEDQHRAHVAAALVAAGIGPVAQAKVEALREAAKYLRRHGAALFNKRGPQDARGAGLWDAGCAIDPDDGDAFSVGHAAPPEDTP
jgi:hypothetical protein